MTRLTNGQHACVLVLVPMNISCDCQLLFSILDELYVLMFHARLDAVGNILRVHYKSMKLDVSFSQGSINTIFR